MSDKRLFVLNGPGPRQNAIQGVKDAQEGYRVSIAPPSRTADQNAKFHAICGDLAKSKFPWAGKPRTGVQWKVLLVSAHAVATQEGSEIVPGLEGEFVNIRESTALMSKKRGSSLIEYSVAFCAMNAVPLHEYRRHVEIVDADTGEIMEANA